MEEKEIRDRTEELIKQGNSLLNDGVLPLSDPRHELWDGDVVELAENFGENIEGQMTVIVHGTMVIALNPVIARENRREDIEKAVKLLELMKDRPIVPKSVEPEKPGQVKSQVDKRVQVSVNPMQVVNVNINQQQAFTELAEAVNELPESEEKKGVMSKLEPLAKLLGIAIGEVVNRYGE